MNPFDAVIADLRALASSPRELWLIYGMKLMESIAYFAVYSLLAIFLTDDHALNDAASGSVVGTWSTGVSLMVFVAGFIADAMGIRKALFWATLSCAVGRTLLAFTPDLGGVYLALALSVWGIGSMKPTMNAAVRAYTTPATVAFAFSLYYVIMNLGSVAQGPLITQFREWFKLGVDVGPLHLSASQAVFGVSAVCSLVNVGLASLIRDNPPGTIPAPKQGSPLLIAREVMREKAFWVFMSFVALLTFVRLIFQHAHLTWPKYTIREFGEDFPFANYWIINPILVIFLTPFATALTRNLKPYPVIVGGALLSSISVFAMSLSSTIEASLVFIATLSLGEVLWSPRLYEYTATIAPRGRESSYMGLSEVPLFLAKPLAGWVSGLLLMKYCPPSGDRDSTTMWFIIGLTTIAAPLLMLFLRKHLEAPDRIESKPS